MQDNFALVEKGFNILHPLLADYIGLALNRKYHNDWWYEVEHALSDQYDLPHSGSYGELLDSLDKANCLRLIDRFWGDVFRFEQDINFRTWSKELMGVRNVVAHRGTKDMDSGDAERALDTMARLCACFDEEGAEEIREIYNALRYQDAPAAESSAFVAQQPLYRNGKSGDLLKLVGTDAVQRTTLTRKVTFGGKTEAYPVYRVRLDLLYYNDQNDRIATWISRYRSEQGQDALNALTLDAYNNVIENFIVESNSDAIKKTQNNILMVGQREPGVALADGRIVDGNRRFTCLRRIAKTGTEPVYFETVLMDVDIQKDKKQIKLLELAIQHGEEKKVDYDLIDFAVGTYMDVVKTGLLTMEEYASGTNEPVADVRKRIDLAELICDFLTQIGLPEQFHVAREYKVVDILQEMMTPLRQLQTDERKQLKTIVCNNVVMHAVSDQRKFIRDIKGLVKNNTYGSYFAEQLSLNEKIKAKLSAYEIASKADLDKFAMENDALTEELQMSLQRALLRSRNLQLKTKPSEHVSKCIDLMTEIDPRLFTKLSEDDRQALQRQMEELANIASGFAAMLNG